MQYNHTQNPVQDAGKIVGETLKRHLDEGERVTWLLSGGSGKGVAHAALPYLSVSARLDTLMKIGSSCLMKVFRLLVRRFIVHSRMSMQKLQPKILVIGSASNALKVTFVWQYSAWAPMATRLALNRRVRLLPRIR